MPYPFIVDIHPSVERFLFENFQICSDSHENLLSKLLRCLSYEILELELGSHYKIIVLIILL